MGAAEVCVRLSTPLNPADHMAALGMGGEGETSSSGPVIACTYQY